VPLLLRYARHGAHRRCAVSNTGMRSFLTVIIFLATLLPVAVAQNTAKPAIQVELNRQRPLHLLVTLRSGAATTVTFYEADLPWGIRDSMVYAAMRPNGEAIDLQDVIRDLNVTKKSDVLLFWAYRSPKELHIPRWSGGLVVITQQK
jgi:hypothetical protein